MTVKELIESNRIKELIEIEIREYNYRIFSTSTKYGNDYIKCVYDREVNEWFAKDSIIVIDLVPLEK